MVIVISSFILKFSPKIFISALLSETSYLHIISPIFTLEFLSSSLEPEPEPEPPEVAIKIIIIINKRIKAPVTPAIIKYFFELGLTYFSSAIIPSLFKSP